MKRQHAFTLVELLAVIAIIALLSAIIFPVFARARDNANRAGDISSLNELRTSLQLYRQDFGGYPPSLLGFVDRYSTGPQAGQVIPADLITSALFPKRVRSLETFRPRPVRVTKTALTTAVWPVADSRALGQAPIVDTNGDNQVTAADDIAGARQAYSNSDTVAINRGVPVGPGNPAAEFYQISGYDVAQNPKSIGNRANEWELRYTLFWTNYSIGTGAGYGSGSAFDDPRQLGYNDPPESTVITWNSYYRDWEPAGVNRIPQRSNRDIVLFLGGAARPFDSRKVWDYAWRSMP
ncbi:MAG: type II secretion system protein [Chthonomonas sp.]|nr:type II secretion system protein [Chthonomonas sp.]